MTDQEELPIDPLRESLRQRFRERAKARPVSTPALVDEMLAANEISEKELKRYARRGLVKEAQDALNAVNPTTGVPDFETIPGTRNHMQVDLFDYPKYSGRILELLSMAEQDLEGIQARLDYCQSKFHQKPRVPKWFTAWRRER